MASEASDCSLVTGETGQVELQGRAPRLGFGEAGRNGWFQSPPGRRDAQQQTSAT